MSEARPAPRPEKKRPPAEAGGVSVWGLLASDLVEGHATRNKCRCSETRGRHLEVDRLADGRTLRIFLHESRPFFATSNAGCAVQISIGEFPNR